MKYVITDHNKIAFGTGTFHRSLAGAISGDVVSAGSFRIVNGNVEVFGRSEDYGIESKPEDAETISKYLGISLPTLRV